MLTTNDTNNNFGGRAIQYGYPYSINFTTPPSPIEKVTIVSSTATTITLTWKSDNNPLTSYDFFTNILADGI